jgi:hypothetical protein
MTDVLNLLLIEWRFDFQTIDWRVASVVVAVISLALVLYFQWWRNRKRLSYEILSNVLLLSAEEEIQDKVEIQYEGKPVKNVRLLLIKLVNDGYQPIKKEDFQRSIKFVFPEAKILSAERVKLNPENLEVETNYQPFSSTVEVKPTLFNRKDYLQFKVLLSGYTEMKIDARIVGVSRIKKAVNRFDLWFSVILFQIMFAMFTWITISSFRTGHFYLSIGIMVISILFIMMMARLLLRMHQTEPRDLRF